MTDRKLMQQALDALDKLLDKLNADICDNSGIWDEYCDGGNAMQALRARLAQPEPEPVAWFMEGTFEDGTPSFTQVCETDHEFYVPLYTAPPQREWQGLTEYEVGFLTVFDGLYDVEVPLLANFIRHIEAKLKEKNT